MNAWPTRPFRRSILGLQGTLDQADNLRTLLASFNALGDFAVDSRHPSTVRGQLKNGHLFIPVSVHEKTGNYILDTGANFSTLTESEALRLGLRVVDLNVDGGQVGDATGNGVERPRIAVADQLSIGKMHFRNVPFLVVSDSPEAAFSDLPVGYRGAIGIQILLACRTIRWGPDLVVHLDDRGPRHYDMPGANLCFNGLTPLTQASFASGAYSYSDTALDFDIDTGADGSALFRRFAEQYPDVLRASGTPGRKWVGGAGGSIETPATILPELALRLGGLAATLKPAYVLPKDVEWDGTVGMEIFEQAHEVRLDFGAMTLTLSK